MRVWIVGPPGGGKTALLERLRGYRVGAAEAVLYQDREAADPPPAVPAQDFAMALPGDGGALPLSAGRVVYVDRAAHHRPATPAASDVSLIPGGEAALGGARAAHHRPTAPPPAGSDVWLVPEGEEALGGEFEAAFLGDTLRELGASLTLLPAVFPSAAATPGRSAVLARYIERRLRWGGALSGAAG